MQASQTYPSHDSEHIPYHVAIIMDGNGRWANSRSLNRTEGHQEGAKVIPSIVKAFGEHGVKMLTLFGFSTENWGRPKSEVEAILSLAKDFIDEHLEELHKANVKLKHLGSLEQLPYWLKNRVQHAVQKTSNNSAMTLNLAFNYGGRADIISAVKQLIDEGFTTNEITEHSISNRLATAGLPDPDLLIRTGGENRLSNFLVWEATYTEYYFTETLWPDFGPLDIEKAIKEYGRRQRRFGLITD